MFSGCPSVCRKTSGSPAADGGKKFPDFLCLSRTFFLNDLKFFYVQYTLENKTGGCFPMNGRFSYPFKDKPQLFYGPSKAINATVPVLSVIPL